MSAPTPRCMHKGCTAPREVEVYNRRGELVKLLCRAHAEQREAAAEQHEAAAEAYERRQLRRAGGAA
jgi:hypothetical protein